MFEVRCSVDITRRIHRACPLYVLILGLLDEIPRLAAEGTRRTCRDWRTVMVESAIQSADVAGF